MANQKPQASQPEKLHSIRVLGSPNNIRQVLSYLELLARNTNEKLEYTFSDQKGTFMDIGLQADGWYRNVGRAINTQN